MSERPLEQTLSINMEEDLIVVDDIDAETQPDIPPPLAGPSSSSQRPQPQRTVPERASSSRLRSASSAFIAPGDNAERTTRSSAVRPKVQPKLKLKLSEKAAAQAPGMSFLGQYDRELDSDDEELAFEEQFILRMQAGEDLDKLRKMVQTREITNDVWFKFKGICTLYFYLAD
jgi:transcription initiation factor TFIID subunit 7